MINLMGQPSLAKGGPLWSTPFRPPPSHCSKLQVNITIFGFASNPYNPRCRMVGWLVGWMDGWMDGWMVCRSPLHNS